MDANGLSFWLLGDGADWHGREHVRWDAACGALALASERRLDTPVDATAFGVAQGALEAVPRTADRFGGVARWHAAASAVVVHSHLAPDVVRLPLAEAPRDLCAGHDDILYVVFADRVLMHDLRGRFDDHVEPTGAFSPWRVAAAADGGLWLLERGSGRLARLSGRPMPITTPPRDFYAPGVFRPEPENCRPPRLDLMPPPPYAAGETPVALAAHADAVLGVLAWGTDGAARVHALRQGRWAAPQPLADARYAYALAWFDAQRLALRLPQRREAPSFDLAGVPGEDGTLLPLGEVHPLAAQALEAPFVHRLDGPPRVPMDDGSAEPLLPLSRRFLAVRGQARHWRLQGSGATAVLEARLLDSGRPATVWHRLYAEASIPPGCGFVVWLAASAGSAPPDEASDDWQPHAFGADVAPLAGDELPREAPRAAWSRAASELPGHPGLGRWSREPGRRGLFEVLIQHGGRRVRRLVGRYLWMRVVLYGNVQSGPEIVALRAYAGRFDYVDRYLPRLYRESVHGDAAAEPGELLARFGAGHADELDTGVLPAALRADLDAGLATDATPGLPPPTVRVRVEQPGLRWRLVDDTSGAGWPLCRRTTLVAGSPVTELRLYRPQATPSDFLSRLLASFEGVLTTLEDRVAAAHLLSDPAVAADAQLDWLGSWIGVAFDPALPAARRRAWLQAAPLLARWHGTRRGLAMALDVATGAGVEAAADGTLRIGASTPGGVTGGEIVVIEDFRLRRLVATLLGVDLADEEDPLLGGLVRSGNSVVGDTLALGDHATTELLALFREEVASAAEDAAVRRFYGRLAHRVTVLVHREVEPQDFALIRRIAELEAPAHVQVRVVGATWPLLVGVASLVGVDTYLGPPRPRRPARVQVSTLGLGDLVVSPAVLDPRMAGSAAPPLSLPPPVADAGPDRSVPYATSFLLDGSGSHAATPGGRIETYIWRRLPPDAA